uniref:GPCR5 n=1 Tax=Penaeus japonicus TaxID=27405 RepID=A0A7U3S1H5_PENJP|nr:GPCR5 [Penaeus japonicus]
MASSRTSVGAPPLGRGLWGVVVVAWALAASVASEDQVPVFPDALPLPRCCAHGQALAADGSCVRHRRAAFTPQVIVGETLVEAINVVKEPPTAVDCAVLGGSEMVLPLVHGQTVIIADPLWPPLLYWKPTVVSDPISVKDFCIGVRAQEGAQEDQYVVKICNQNPVALPTTCQSTYCYRKCCPEGHEFSGIACVLSNDSWQVVFSSKDDPSVTLPPHADLDVAYGVPQCQPLLVYDDFTLGPKGELHLPGGVIHSHSLYCVTRRHDGGSKRDIALVCAPEIERCDWKNDILKPVLMSLSCFFLCITAIVYLSVPDLRSSLNGRCLIAFVISMFIGFLTILVIARHSESFGSFQCTFSAFFCLTFILATFFWLNVMYFRIWSVIRKPGQDDPNTWRFFALCAYGFGCPLVVVIVGIALDLAEADVVRPNFVLPYCWFNSNISRWAYQYGIILALLVVNLILLVWSAVLTARRLKTWMIHRTSDSNHGIILFFWLLLIMGVAWIFEIITWQAPSQCSIWVIVIDSINALQGVFVFLASVVFRKDLKLQGWSWIQVPSEEQDPANGRYATSNIELERPATRGTE